MVVQVHVCIWHESLRMSLSFDTMSKVHATSSVLLQSKLTAILLVGQCTLPGRGEPTPESCGCDNLLLGQMHCTSQGHGEICIQQWSKGD